MEGPVIWHSRVCILSLSLGKERDKESQLFYSIRDDKRRNVFKEVHNLSFHLVLIQYEMNKTSSQIMFNYSNGLVIRLVSLMWSFLWLVQTNISAYLLVGLTEVLNGNWHVNYYNLLYDYVSCKLLITIIMYLTKTVNFSICFFLEKEDYSFVLFLEKKEGIGCLKKRKINIYFKCLKKRKRHS